MCLILLISGKPWFDSGGEYIDRGFKEYCAANNIRMEKTIPGTPQQNGVAKRMNKTINERTRSIRLHFWSPKMFWVDKVNTVFYLINWGPSVLLEQDCLRRSEQKGGKFKSFKSFWLRFLCSY